MTRTPRTFSTRINQLKEYAHTHGHTDVPYAQAPLGRWVGYIRQRYEEGLLTAEQKAALESITGWSWTARKPGPRRNEEAHRQIKELRSQRLSLQQIADQVNLSRQRVHQILKETA